MSKSICKICQNCITYISLNFKMYLSTFQNVFVLCLNICPCGIWQLRACLGWQHYWHFPKRHLHLSNSFSSSLFKYSTDDKGFTKSTIKFFLEHSVFTFFHISVVFRNKFFCLVGKMPDHRSGPDAPWTRCPSFGTIFSSRWSVCIIYRVWIWSSY